MTHESERAYMDAVEAFLTDFYDDVRREPSDALPSGREPDFVVHTPLHVLYVEVENDAEAAVHTGPGQAVQYAGEAQVKNEEQALPVVISPHWESPETEGIRQYVSTATVPTDYESGDLDA